MDVFFEQYKPASSIAEYLAIGSKTNGIQSLGFELEHFVVERESLASVPYCVDVASPAPSVEKVLERIQGFYDESVYEDDGNGNPHLFGLGRDRIAITLEPGAQLEVSIGPTYSVREIEEVYQAFREEIDSALDEMGLELLELGYHPTRQAHELPLLPKLRYQFMDNYFAQTGRHGICMMRATASTQISIDYTDEDDAIEKFRVANALGPLLAFITDNAPVFEAEKVGARGGSVNVAKSGLTVPNRMARMACWDDTDPQRSLVAKGSFDEDFSFLRYAEVLVESPGIFLPSSYGQRMAGEKTVEKSKAGEANDPIKAGEACGTGSAEVRRENPGCSRRRPPDLVHQCTVDTGSEYLASTTFKQVLPNEFLDEDTVLHILSLFFFDARFKTYLELRQADSMPLRYALAYAALVYGLFYNPKAMGHYSNSFLYTDATAVAFAKSALRNHGYEAEVYGRPASEWLEEMLRFAAEGLAEEDAAYLVPLAELVSARTTLLEGQY